MPDDSATTQTAAAPARSAGAVAIAETRPASRVPRHLERFLCLDDFEPAARRHLPRMLYGFVSGACERDQSLADNREAFAEWGFVPRGLVDVTARSTRTTLLGREYAAPFGIPPMGATALSAYRGDVVLARAARAAGIPMILSASSLIPLEAVRKAGGEATWYQAYLPGEPDRIIPLVERVLAAGFDHFVLTIDVPTAANRENNVRNGYALPLRPSLNLAWQGISHPSWLFETALRTLYIHGMPHFENMDAGRGPPVLSADLIRKVGRRDGLAWEHLELIRKRWPGKLLVKGVLAAEDAKIARESGCDGIMVSNHGGRQLDGAVSPLRVLPECAAEAGGMAVILDGGVRRGTDVLKALALGAQFVFVGRPFLYAAAVAGEDGVAHGIGLLRDEIDRDMAMLGINRLAEMTGARLRRVKPAP